MDAIASATTQTAETRKRMSEWVFIYVQSRVQRPETELAVFRMVGAQPLRARSGT